MSDTIYKRSAHSSVALDDNRKMVISGSDEAAIEIYDIKLNKWSASPNMSTKRVEPTAVTYKSKVYVFGGSGNGGTAGIIDTCEVYEEDTKTGESKWSPIASMPGKRRQIVAFLSWLIILY